MTDRCFEPMSVLLTEPVVSLIALWNVLSDGEVWMLGFNAKRKAEKIEYMLDCDTVFRNL